MANIIRSNTNLRQVIRFRKKSRITKKLKTQKGLIARLVVYRSNKFIYAQVVDDLKAHTLAQASTSEKEFPGKGVKKNLESAKELGKLIAKRALENKIDRVVFDRNGYEYHGRIKAVADGAREAGLNF
jgi:large subunit ribosomal protein L18